MPSHEATALALEAIDRHLVVPVIGGFISYSCCYRCPIGGDPRIACQQGNSATFSERVCRADHHLARHAAKVGTLAAQQALVDSDHIEVRLRQPAGEILTTGAHAYDNDVDLFHKSLRPDGDDQTP